MTKDTRIRLSVWPVVAMSLAGVVWGWQSGWVALGRLGDYLDKTGHAAIGGWAGIIGIVAMIAAVNFAAFAITDVATKAARAIRIDGK